MVLPEEPPALPWTLPAGDDRYPERWRLIKLAVRLKALPAAQRPSAPAANAGRRHLAAALLGAHDLLAA
ncbi:MAG: hypothetical protein U5K33_09325 [Halofilum sp. (in: g-proteobacteria)]|nr:hypothetical protein [Halofilum sp. (in: g-proteobacteria)]